MKILLAALAAAGMTIASYSGAKAEDLKVEVIHWFTSKSEAEGIRALADALKARGVEWVDTAIAGGDAAMAAANNRMVAGNPPGALQFNTGKQLDELYAKGLIRNVDAIAEKEHWKDVLPPAFYDAIVRDGHVVAIPINNYAQNRLFYSKKVLDDAGIAVPKTWDEMFTAMDKLKSRNVIPLALGGQPWQEETLFNAVLAGAGGPDLYMKIWQESDAASVRSDGFKKVAEIFGKLRNYVDDASPNRDWNLSTLLLSSNKAAFQFMGDWAKGELVAAGLKPDEGFGGVFGPGSDIFIFGGDVFVLPVSKDAAVTKAQDIFASAVFSADAQTKASLAWGSIPARTDIDADKFDAVAKYGITAMRDPKRSLPDDNILATNDNVQSLRDLIAEYWADDTMTPDQFVERWVSAADLAR